MHNRGDKDTLVEQVPMPAKTRSIEHSEREQTSVSGGTQLNSHALANHTQASTVTATVMDNSLEPTSDTTRSTHTSDTLVQRDSTSLEIQSRLSLPVERTWDLEDGQVPIEAETWSNSYDLSKQTTNTPEELEVIGAPVDQATNQASRPAMTITMPSHVSGSSDDTIADIKHDVMIAVLEAQNETIPWSSVLTGWRFWIVNIALGSGIFLSQMETTIVSTSLISITNDLDGFQSVSWIVTAYLVTYTGFLAIISKMSDIFGRKPLTIISFIIFVLSSVGCGLARTMNQLIILRAFQGIGGGGIYAMAYVIFPEMGTPEMYAGYAAYLSLMAALACLLGPLLGGAINDNTTWRWVFWINVPVGVVAIVLLLIALPRNFPNPPCYLRLGTPYQKITQRLERIDAVGTFLLLGASMLLVTALEEGGTAYSWTSAIPLACIIISLSLWVGFVFWERYLYQHRKRTIIEATFPWDLMTHRFSMGCLWNALFVGGMFLVLAITIPQRLQVVHGDSPLKAGVRILPLTLFLPLGTIISGGLQARARIAPLYTFSLGGIIQTIGIGLLSSTTVNEIGPTFYVYQGIAGFGLGISLATSIMTIPLVVSKENRAVAMGSIGQFRMLGGAIILAVFTNILNNPISAELSSILSPDQLSALLQSAAYIDLLPPALRADVLDTYESGYQKQLHVLIAFSVGAILASLLLLERNPRRQRTTGVLT